MRDPLWSILIVTVGARTSEFQAMTANLHAQIEASGRADDVEVVVHWCNFETALGDARQALLDDARGAYVCFVDDDDELPPYYVTEVLAALDQQPAMVGWRQQIWIDGVIQKPTYHSLRFNGWSEDRHGWYRATSHLNPLRIDLARLGRFDTPPPEDVAWAAQVEANLPPGTTSLDIDNDKPMYFYRYSPSSSL